MSGLKPRPTQKQEQQHEQEHEQRKSKSDSNNRCNNKAAAKKATVLLTREVFPFETVRWRKALMLMRFHQENRSGEARLLQYEQNNCGKPEIFRSQDVFFSEFRVTVESPNDSSRS